jgi:hypothetical protein
MWGCIKFRETQLMQSWEGYSINSYVPFICSPLAPFSSSSSPLLSLAHSSRPNTKIPTSQGGSVAHRVFHTRLLPHILLGRKADGLPEAFHEHAHAVCNDIGGKEGKLILDRPAPHAPTIALSNRKTVPKRTPREAASIRVPLS